jgi:hypothetical protein
MACQSPISSLRKAFTASIISRAFHVVGIFFPFEVAFTTATVEPFASTISNCVVSAEDRTDHGRGLECSVLITHRLLNLLAQVNLVVRAHWRGWIMLALMSRLQLAALAVLRQPDTLLPIVRFDQLRVARPLVAR